MNWDFLNRKLKEFFEQRRQQSIDKLFTLNAVTDNNFLKKQFLELETQVTEEQKQIVSQPSVPITTPTPSKSKQTPKSFNQISYLFSPHGPARSTNSMQMRQIVTSNLKNGNNSYNHVKSKDIKKVQELVGSNSKTSFKNNGRKLQKQQTSVSQKILKDLDDQFDPSPTNLIKPCESLKCFITQTKNINTLSMKAQLKLKSQRSIRQLKQPSPALDNFTKLGFGNSTDPRVGLDRFLSNKWLQFVIEQKSMRKDDQFDNYLQQYNESKQKEQSIQKLKQKQQVRQDFNSEIPQSLIFKPHRYTKKITKVKKNEISELISSYSQTVFDIEKKRDDDELIEFYPIYYEKKVKRRRIIRKMKILAKKAIKLRTFVLDLLQKFQQFVPYQMPGSIAFLRFVQQNNLQAVKEMLDQDNSFIGSFNEQGQYAIHLGVMIQSIEMVKLLLYYRANVNSEDFFLQKPLYFALITDNLQIIRLLLACRASPWDENLRDYFVCCRSEDAKNLIKLGQYLKIYNKDPECILNIENIKQQLNQY
ncbi:unnamed protein product (macronuclear) [Paramecium tetraurelia]|uniref:Uncharacterized protein n=1 Tax=Paramecium tetraurelia TaxID=5888 RepID=A0BFY4_PARTE|nr:uncharacterized protein GSPATT00028486001 [Paramecium tetraurelia]CAK57451.1 unnamed protein product [Paramecium tetraurelia]|eukprot:XP_001424849.1 hypothetical protein (macronuclear) [Paramecium tetraurelia strain d4-2]